ncbi:MAG: hypothetical protein AB7T06_40600 [Kofleriaceae bacterium]
MSRSTDPRVVEILAVVDQCMDDEPELRDTAAVFWIIEAMATTIDRINSGHTPENLRAMVAALCELVPSGVLDEMLAEAQKQRQTNNELRAEDAVRGAGANLGALTKRGAA